MFEFCWNAAYAEWERGQENAEREAAFRAGWHAALAHVLACLEDEYSETGGTGGAG